VCGMPLVKNKMRTTGKNANRSTLSPPYARELLEDTEEQDVIPSNPCDSDENDVSPVMQNLTDQLFAMQERYVFCRARKMIPAIRLLFSCDCFSFSFDGYHQTLQKLLELPGPPQHPVPFATSQAQTVLVTNYADLSKDSTDPWPPEHEVFLESDASKRLLVLEIACGSAVGHPPQFCPKGTRAGESTSTATATRPPVLLPGSLRERGEFSLVEMSLVRDGSNSSSRGGGGPAKYRWTVRNVEFFNIHTRPH
jgi:hypothetical protein